MEDVRKFEADQIAQANSRLKPESGGEEHAHASVEERLAATTVSDE
jgi:hypothetical protein